MRAKAKPAPKPDDPEQYRRFVETAREVEADESPDAMDRAFDRVIGSKKGAEGLHRITPPKKKP
jgi:hypothetical protein